MQLAYTKKMQAEATVAGGRQWRRLYGAVRGARASISWRRGRRGRRPEAWTDKEDMEVANDSRLVMDNNDDVKAIEAMGKHRILGRPLDLFILAAFSGGLVGYLLYALSPSSLPPYLKSVNLQYNTLGCLNDGTNESSTKHLMFQVLFFFHDFLQNSLQKSFQFIFLFFFIK